MKIAIDLSVHSRTGTAVGVVSGILEFACIVGEQVSLAYPTTESIDPLMISGFIPHVKISQILHVPSSEPKVMVSFEEAVLPSDEAATVFMQYLEKGFGLFADFFI
jgi:hypothetical protein